VYIALKELAKLPQDPQIPRRRAIIVLSDGDDTSSLVTFDDVLDLASRSDTAICTIGLGPREPASTRNNQDGQFVLRRLTQQTGGRAFFPQDIKELAGVYSDIREELASQYALAYESSTGRRDGQWRRIAVRVNVRTSPSEPGRAISLPPSRSDPRQVCTGMKRPPMSRVPKIVPAACQKRRPKEFVARSHATLLSFVTRPADGS